jgi:hypothetical protein
MADKDFFLSSDDAQTLGNINFMRKSVRVKRTFPKTKANPTGFSVTKELSSLEDRSYLDQQFSTNGNGSAANNSTSYIEPQSSFNNGNGQEKGKNIEERRQEDSSLDMFRNMARNINRR